MTNALTLMREWSDLPAPELSDVEGELRADFVAPLRHLAPKGLGLLGLPRWHGKRFAGAGPDALSGINLVRSRTDATVLEERLPMRAVRGDGIADGRPAVIVTYPGDAPRPWRWVRDEVRALDESTLQGMTYVDLPGLRRVGLPFLLRR